MKWGQQQFGMAGNIKPTPQERSSSLKPEPLGKTNGSKTSAFS